MTQEKMSESAKTQENMGSLKKKCAGMNCNFDYAAYVPHSPECIAEHAAAAANGRFVKHGSQPPSAGGEMDATEERLVERLRLAAERYALAVDSEDKFEWEEAQGMYEEDALNVEIVRLVFQKVTTRDQQIAKLEARVATLTAKLTDISNWPDGGSSYGQTNIKRFAAEALAKGDQQ